MFSILDCVINRSVVIRKAKASRVSRHPRVGVFVVRLPTRWARAHPLRHFHVSRRDFTSNMSASHRLNITSPKAARDVIARAHQSTSADRRARLA